MAKIDKSSIVLDEVETTIRQLLLDVVEFIKENPVPKIKDAADSQVHIPNDLANTPLELRWTGGWVRDKLLKVGSKDIDIAVNKMTGYQFGLRMKEYLDIDENSEKYFVPGTKKAASTKLHKIEANPAKSKNLETTTTRIFGLDLDLVNLRKEMYSSDSRNPVIDFGTPEEDALRRDATINAMFYNLHTCLVEDFTGRGLEDLECGIIRTPLEPATTFIDDPLRVLRLIRFATRYGYVIDQDSQKSMASDDIKEAFLAKITRERVWQEIEKMLKGPNPKDALQYFQKLGLYNVIFTNPGPKTSFEPEIGGSWSASVETAADIISPEASGVSEQLGNWLVKDDEEAFQTWMMAALVPWADAPQPEPLKSGRQAPPVISMVARDGLKAPNKIVDLLALCMKNMREIRIFKDTTSVARDDLGMAIRGWGGTWRQQVMFALLHDVCGAPDAKSDTLSGYANFIETCANLDLLEAYDFKPLLDGKQLCAALDTSPGIWTKSALDIVMRWQLRNPDVTDSKAALEEVRAWKDSTNISEPPKKRAKKQGELTSVLTSHFLRLTLRPLFSQAPNNPNLTPAGRKNINANINRHDHSDIFNEEIRPWKRKDIWSLDLLNWICKNLDEECVQREWGFLVPPILTILDDTEVHIKARGCGFVRDILRNTSPKLLKQTGLTPVFEESLINCTTYLPSITNEDDSIHILNAAFPALVALVDTAFPESNPPIHSPARVKFLVSIYRKGFLAGYRHAGENVRVAQTLLTHLPPIINALGIDSVVHLKELIPLLSDLLADPFAPASPSLLSTALTAYKAVISNTWPRIGHWRADVLRGLCTLWLRIQEEECMASSQKNTRSSKSAIPIQRKHLEEQEQIKEQLMGVQAQLKDMMYGLNQAVLANSEFETGWPGELRMLLEADDNLQGLFADVLCKV